MHLSLDGIWISTPEQEEEAKKNWPLERAQTMVVGEALPTDIRERALIHEARLAREATVKFFYLATEVSSERNAGEFSSAAQERLVKRLNDNFFNGTFPIEGIREVFPNGAINCETLQ